MKHPQTYRLLLVSKTLLESEKSERCTWFSPLLCTKMVPNRSSELIIVPMLRSSGKVEAMMFLKKK